MHTHTIMLRVRELRGKDKTPVTPLSFTTTTTTPTATPPSTHSHHQPESPRGGGSNSNSDLKHLLEWHRSHLASLKSLAKKEEELLRAIEGDQISVGDYKSSLNEVLISQALLYSDIPSSLD